MYPAVLREFQSQMWLRISETSRIAHRSREEDFSAKRFQKQDDKMKLEKALQLLGGARDTSSLVASAPARARDGHSLAASCCCEDTPSTRDAASLVVSRCSPRAGVCARR